jgi:hypothetical protein
MTFVDAKWLIEVVDVLQRAFGDEDKVVQPSKVGLAGLQLLKVIKKTDEWKRLDKKQVAIRDRLWKVYLKWAGRKASDYCHPAERESILLVMDAIAFRHKVYALKTMKDEYWGDIEFDLQLASKHYEQLRKLLPKNLK